MTCVARHISYNGRSRGFQNLQPGNAKELKRWRAAVCRAGLVYLAHVHKGSALPPQPHQGPVLVIATFTIARPATVPLNARPWPFTKSPGHGDVDKLSRALLDGLADAGVYSNDAQVVGLHAWKRYPDSPEVEWIDRRDHLDRPGVVWRLVPLEDQAPELPYELTLDQDERTGA
jgi:hypothetical protein